MKTSGISFKNAACSTERNIWMISALCPIRSPNSISVVVQQDCLLIRWRRATTFTSSYSHTFQHLQQQSISASLLHHQTQLVRAPQVGLAWHIPQLERGCHERCWCAKCGTWHQGSWRQRHLDCILRTSSKLTGLCVGWRKTGMVPGLSSV